MTTDYFHGAEFTEVDTPLRTIRIVRSGVIGLVGSARDLKVPGRRNVPVLIRTEQEAATTFDGALATALEEIYDQASTLVVVVNVFDPATMFGAASDAADYDLVGGEVTIETAKGATLVSVKKGQTAAVEGTDYTWDSAAGKLERVDTSQVITGDADTLSVSYKLPDPGAATADDVTAAIDGDGNWRGIEALRGAEAATGHRPRLLIAPGFSSKTTGAGQDLAAPVVDELDSVAARLRAIAIVEAPSTTDAAAVAFRGATGSRRVFIVEPEAASDVAGKAFTGSSARVAGLFAANDTRRGWWTSPSNQPIRGITALKRPIDWSLDDKGSRANYLNSQDIAVIARIEGLMRLWGSRTASTDPKWAFVQRVRTADILNDSLVRAHLWAVDELITKSYLRDVSGEVNRLLRTYTAREILAFARCIPSPINTPEQIEAGHVYFDFEYATYGLSERLTFRSLLRRADVPVVEVVA